LSSNSSTTRKLSWVSTSSLDEKQPSQADSRNDNESVDDDSATEIDEPTEIPPPKPKKTRKEPEPSQKRQLEQIFESASTTLRRSTRNRRLSSTTVDTSLNEENEDLYTFSTHVVNTETGMPARGMEFTLDISTTSGWRQLCTMRTDDEGRANKGLPSLVPGVYRLTFDSNSYFMAQGSGCFYPTVPVIFKVLKSKRGTQKHYHVPLMISPYGYSTYRGSYVQ